MELKDKLLVLLGDSITEGVGASSVCRAYPAILQRLTGARIHLDGISGSRIARQRVVTDQPCDRDFCMRLNHLPLEADALFIFGGTNDYGHGEAPVGSSEDRSPFTFWGACHTLFAGLKTRYPGKPILVATPLHRSSENDPAGDGTNRKLEKVEGLAQYSRILAAAASDYGFPLLDFFNDPSLPREGDPAFYAFLPDGLHPSDTGHAFIARQIARRFRSL